MPITLLNYQLWSLPVPDDGVVTHKCIDELKFLVNIKRESYSSTVKPRTTEIQNPCGLVAPTALSHRGKNVARA